MRFDTARQLRFVNAESLLPNVLGMGLTIESYSVHLATCVCDRKGCGRHFNYEKDVKQHAEKTYRLG